MTKAIWILALAPALLPAQWIGQSQFQQPGYVTGRERRWLGVEVNLPRGQVGPVEGRPLSAIEVYHTTQILSDGTHVDQSNISKFYRDAQGRMRSESPARVVIFDPVAGYTYEVNTKDRTYVRRLSAHTQFEWIAAEGNGTHMDATSDSLVEPGGGDPATGYAKRLASRSSSIQQVTEELPPTTIWGISAKGSRITIAIPAGSFGNNREVKVVSERWYSDDLKLLLKSSNSDPRYGVTTYELTQIVQSPPDPELFRVPADYEMRPPR